MLGIQWMETQSGRSKTRRFIAGDETLFEFTRRELPLAQERFIYAGTEGTLDSTALAVPLQDGWQPPIHYDGTHFIPHPQLRYETLRELLRETITARGPLMAIDHQEIIPYDTLSHKKDAKLRSLGIYPPIIRVRAYLLQPELPERQLRWITTTCRDAWDEALHETLDQNENRVTRSA